MCILRYMPCDLIPTPWETVESKLLLLSLSVTLNLISIHFRYIYIYAINKSIEMELSLFFTCQRSMNI